MILPFLDPKDLLRFARLGKHFLDLLDPKSSHCVNYKVLYTAQGYEMTPEEEEQSKKSLSGALSVFSWPQFPTKVAKTTKD